MDRYNTSQENESYRTALICAVMANCHRGKGKVFKVADFMPKKKKKQTQGEMINQLKMIAAAFKG